MRSRSTNEHHGGEGGRESRERKARPRQRPARVPGTLPLIGTRARVGMADGDMRSLSGWLTAPWPRIRSRGPQTDPSQGVEDSLHSLSHLHGRLRARLQQRGVRRSGFDCLVLQSYEELAILDWEAQGLMDGCLKP